MMTAVDSTAGARSRARSGRAAGPTVRATAPFLPARPAGVAAC